MVSKDFVGSGLGYAWCLRLGFILDVKVLSWLVLGLKRGMGVVG